MLHRPKKRNWPSRQRRICANMRRHAAGDSSGSEPSITSTSANAVQNELLSKVVARRTYFRAAGAARLGLRIALKKSLDSSSTITSLFLLKLDLYASRLR